MGTWWWKLLCTKDLMGIVDFFGRSQWSVLWNLIVTCAILSSVWVDYNISLTRIKVIWGWFPLLTMIPVKENSEVVIIYPDPSICITYHYITIKLCTSQAPRSSAILKLTATNSALGNPQAAWTRYTDLEFWPIPQKDQKQAWITLKTVCRAALSLFPTSFFDFVFLGQTLHTAASVFGFPGSALKMVLA